MAKKEGAKTTFVRIPSRGWEAIYKAMDCERCLRTGVVRVEKKGVVILCTRSTRQREKKTCL